MDNISFYGTIAIKDDSNIGFNVRERDWIPAQGQGDYYAVLKLGNVNIHAEPQKWHDIAMHILSKLQEHQEKQIQAGELVE